VKVRSRPRGVSGMQWVTFEPWDGMWWLYVGYGGKRKIELMLLTNAEALMLMEWACQMYYYGVGHFIPDLYGWTWWPN